eukprot:scaffold21905_cov67-Isochrysis_galbana.AAC.1
MISLRPHAEAVRRVFLLGNTIVGKYSCWGNILVGGIFLVGEVLPHILVKKIFSLGEYSCWGSTLVGGSIPCFGLACAGM